MLYDDVVISIAVIDAEFCGVALAGEVATDTVPGLIRSVTEALSGERCDRDSADGVCNIELEVETGALGEVAVLEPTPVRPLPLGDGFNGVCSGTVSM